VRSFAQRHREQRWSQVTVRFETEPHRQARRSPSSPDDGGSVGRRATIAASKRNIWRCCTPCRQARVVSQRWGFRGRARYDCCEQTQLLETLHTMSADPGRLLTMGLPWESTQRLLRANATSGDVALHVSRPRPSPDDGASVEERTTIATSKRNIWRCCTPCQQTQAVSRRWGLCRKARYVCCEQTQHLEMLHSMSAGPGRLPTMGLPWESALRLLRANATSGDVALHVSRPRPSPDDGASVGEHATIAASKRNIWRCCTPCR
jgi:hypothetical protein